MKYLSALLLIAAAFLPQEVLAVDTRIYITSTASTTWDVPSDWNNSANTIEVIGGGAGGWKYGTNSAVYASGGGGGGYSKITNTTLTPSATVGIKVGAGGGNSASGTDSYLCNSTSNCASIAGSAVIVGAKGGSTGITYSLATGGQASSGVGDVKYSGGHGGDSISGSSGSGGGGGAAGLYGAGADGQQGCSTNYAGGGGGNGGGYMGTTCNPSTGGGYYNPLTQVSNNSGTPNTRRADGSGYDTGFGFNLSTTTIVITHLGRYKDTGDSNTHLMILADNGSNALRTATVDMSNSAEADGYVYVALSSPITIVSGTTYFVSSTETTGVDHFYDYTSTVTPTSDITIQGGYYHKSGAGQGSGLGGTNHTYGPVSFKYLVPYGGGTLGVDGTGGGGGGGGQYSTISPGNGSNGTEWDSTHGSGGGGGGSGPYTGAGGVAGNYGGGGGGGAYPGQNGGAGANGIIVITYTPGGGGGGAVKIIINYIKSFFGWE